MIERLSRCVEYREPLPSAAYFCLDVLESFASDGRAAAKYLQVAYTILNTIRRLSSTAGGSDARKAKGRGRDLTPQEHESLVAALKAMIGRAAEKAAEPDANFVQITMANLPPL
jgi:hypothetical protein